VTVTLVTVAPDAGQPRHSHSQSEQVWLVQRGRAELLLAAGATRRIGEGDVVRTPAGETHGLRNIGPEPFVYIAVTTPPVDFRPAYAEER
jgi:quercetin dioxygenase-like cupin family protein